MVPWANTAVEAELPYFLECQASLHSARLVPKAKRTELDDNFLWGLITAIPEAWESLSRLPLNAVAFCCTSASVFDPRSMGELEHNLSAIPLPTTTAFTSLVRQLKKVKAKDIVLITPYVPTITEQEARAFSLEGFNVVNTASLAIDDGFDQVTPDTLLSLARSAFQDSDAIVISCTGLYTREAISSITKLFNRPCLSSNSAIAQSLLDIA
jgi:maleate isomerase